MNRLFVFGCSFTRYWRWPTWANILAANFDHFQNWGICGGGNASIFHSLVEAHKRHNIGADDTVIVMWTNTSREDHYVKDRWLEGGNVYWGEVYSDDYIKKFACERGYLIRDLSLITAAQQLLLSWKCRWRFASMVPFDKTNTHNYMGKPGGKSDAYLHDVLTLYQDTLQVIAPSVYETVFRYDWLSRPGIINASTGQRDFHPTPAEHLIYLDQTLPEFTVDDVTRTWVNDITQKLQQGSDIGWKEPGIPTRF
jgi:hypothetical protein